MSHDYKKEIEETKELIEKLEATSSKVAEAIDKTQRTFQK